MTQDDREWHGQVCICCPFCGGMAELGDESALHTEPICQAFDELDAEDYVHAVYEILTATADPSKQSS